MKPFLCAAPMAGVTDKPFRILMRSFGNQTLFTEMVGISTLFHNHPLTRKMLWISDETNIVVQLVGIETSYMVHAAKQAAFYGARAININMGCPVKKLISNGSGAALMKTPLMAAHLVEEVKKAVNIPVTVKTRIGWNEENVNILEFAQTLQNAGADGITIHGRTKAQGYSGKAHLEIIGVVKESLSIPVIANGDIMDQKSLQNACEITKADGMMIGRALLGKPWLLQELETGIKPSFCLTDVVLKHLELMLEYYGLHGLLVARKHLAWYAKGKKDVAQFCQNVYAESQVNKVKKIIKDFFETAQREN